METKKQILRKMIKTNPPDLLCDTHYKALWHGFYDFLEMSNLSKADYEKLIIEMRLEGLINVELNGNENNYNSSRIIATQRGVNFIKLCK